MSTSGQSVLDPFLGLDDAGVLVAAPESWTVHARYVLNGQVCRQAATLVVEFRLHSTNPHPDQPVPLQLATSTLVPITTADASAWRRRFTSGGEDRHWTIDVTAPPWRTQILHIR